MKNKKIIIAIIILILIAAGVFVGLKLLRPGKVSEPFEALPTSIPTAISSPVVTKTPEIFQQDEALPCELTFTVSALTPTPTPTTISGCYKGCSKDSDCNPSSSTGTQLVCGSYPCPPGQSGCPDMMVCYNPDCKYEQDCVCPSATPTPTSTGSLTPTPTGRAATTTPVPTTTLPPVGSSFNSIMLGVAGILLLLFGLVLI